mmetsp:Transcript_109226/g.309003  ORF Transcript_109226/g.309003 Transcript_109226/m.309003 type:complete len:337 (-) Transcript_109226:324-1334(-)
MRPARCAEPGDHDADHERPEEGHRRRDQAGPGLGGLPLGGLQGARRGLRPRRQRHDLRGGAHPHLRPVQPLRQVLHAQQGAELLQHLGGGVQPLQPQGRAAGRGRHRLPGVRGGAPLGRRHEGRAPLELRPEGREPLEAPLRLRGQRAAEGRGRLRRLLQEDGAPHDRLRVRRPLQEARPPPRHGRRHHPLQGPPRRPPGRGRRLPGLRPHARRRGPAAGPRRGDLPGGRPGRGPRGHGRGDARPGEDAPEERRLRRGGVGLGGLLPGLRHGPVRADRLGGVPGHVPRQAPPRRPRQPPAHPLREARQGGHRRVLDRRPHPLHRGIGRLARDGTDT